MPALSDVKRIAKAIYRRANRASTYGLPWKRQGDFVTFEWDGFVAAPSIPMLFARHEHETVTLDRLLRDKGVQDCLEFGCGFGRLSPTLARLSRRLTAIDINASAVEAAKAAYPHIDFQAYDGRRLPFADSTFDLVVTWTVVQHIPPELIDDALADITRVLRGGGCVLLCEETRLAGEPSQHAWHRPPEFYADRLAPLQLTYSSYIDEIDSLPGLTSPGRVMFFEP